MIRRIIVINIHLLLFLFSFYLDGVVAEIIVPTGYVVEKIATGLMISFRLAVNPSGDLYVAHMSKVSKVSSDGTKTTFLTGLEGTPGMTFNDQGDLFVSTLEPEHRTNKYNTTSILKVSPDGTITPFITGLPPSVGMRTDSISTCIGGMAFGRDGHLYTTVLQGYSPLSGSLVRFEGGGVKPTDLDYEIDPDHTFAKIITMATGLCNPYDLTFDHWGNIYVGEACRADNVNKVLNGEFVPIAQFVEHDTPTGLAFSPLWEFGPYSNRLLVALFSGRAIVEGISGASTIVAVSGAMDGNYETFASGLTNITDIAFGPEGNLYVCEFFGNIYKISYAP